MKITLKEDYTIPAGTELTLAASKTERFVPFFGVDLGMTQDTTAYFVLSEDAILSRPDLFELTK